MAELQHRGRSRPGQPPAADAEAAPLRSDNADVLNAIAELHAKFDRFMNDDRSEIEKIQLEISDISGRIKATKAEMAALRHPLADEDKFQQASEELTAVVSATETATNVIMRCAEEMEEIVQELRAQLPEGYQSSRVNDVNELIVRIYEACNFQDLTGQRITKVVRALTFIEERVEAMMGLWNRREFELMPLPPGVTKKDGDLELHGPNEENADKGMISQADIDALFD
ncbi:MAG TPA: protein phosphatase CheZ [Arenibaculum sp.]|nr:protein phosphatase CheZ [Arenibaculum sp.]